MKGDVGELRGCLNRDNDFINELGIVSTLNYSEK